MCSLPSHLDLLLFERWADLKDYAEHDPASRPCPLSTLSNNAAPGPTSPPAATSSPSSTPHVTLSTDYKAKGCDWPTVRISVDFTPEYTIGTNEDGRRVTTPSALRKPSWPTSLSPAPATISTYADYESRHPRPSLRRTSSLPSRRAFGVTLLAYLRPIGETSRLLLPIRLRRDQRRQLVHMHRIPLALQILVSLNCPRDLSLRSRCKMHQKERI